MSLSRFDRAGEPVPYDLRLRGAGGLGPDFRGIRVLAVVLREADTDWPRHRVPVHNGSL